MSIHTCDYVYYTFRERKSSTIVSQIVYTDNIVELFLVFTTNRKIVCVEVRVDVCGDRNETKFEHEYDTPQTDPPLPPPNSGSIHI